MEAGDESGETDREVASVESGGGCVLQGKRLAGQKGIKSEGDKTQGGLKRRLICYGRWRWERKKKEGNEGEEEEEEEEATAAKLEIFDCSGATTNTKNAKNAQQKKKKES